MRSAPVLCAFCGGVAPDLFPCDCKTGFHSTCHTVWRWFRDAPRKCPRCETDFVVREPGVLRAWLLSLPACLVAATVLLSTAARLTGAVLPLLSSLLWNAVVRHRAAVAAPSQRSVESIATLVLFLPTLLAVVLDREMGSIFARLLSVLGLFILFISDTGFFLVAPYSFWVSARFLHRQLEPFRFSVSSHAQ